MGIAISSTNKADRHDTTEILWKCALSTLTLALLFVRIDMNHIYAIYVQNTYRFFFILQVFQGNTDTDTEVTVDLPSENEIKAIQIIPQPQFKPIQLRFDLIGCVLGKN